MVGQIQVAPDPVCYELPVSDYHDAVMGGKGRQLNQLLNCFGPRPAAARNGTLRRRRLGARRGAAVRRLVPFRAT